MSKYYKAEDVERLIENICNVMIGKEEPIETALCELPTIEISEDCISREYVRAKLDYISYAEKDPISIAKRIVDNAPSVVVRNKRTTAEQSSMVGEWQNTIGGIYACSNCKSSFTNIPKDGYWKPMWNFCPNCGAKMKGLRNEVGRV